VSFFIIDLPYLFSFLNLFLDMLASIFIAESFKVMLMTITLSIMHI